MYRDCFHERFTILSILYTKGFMTYMQNVCYIMLPFYATESINVNELY